VEQAGPKEERRLDERLVTSSLIRAAGGVLWRPGAEATGDVEVCLIHRPRYDDWTLPKGKLSPGETELEGAVREVFEETGYRVRLGRSLGEVSYLKSSGDEERPKVVRYWTMEATGGGFGPTPEVDELAWMSPVDAREKLTFDRDRDVLARFMAGPAKTTSVLVTRHGSAGSRSKWEGDDRRRPLDEIGWEQAENLVRLFSRFGAAAIHSADYVRCEQTVQPFSEAIGTPIHRDPVFSERGYPGHEAQALNTLREFGQSGVATVVCTQGDVIPDLLTRLTGEDHVDPPSPLPGKKGSVWVLSFDGKHLSSAEYFPPSDVSG
jgi:8-oxo-(d)GTP phosphatase